MSLLADVLAAFDRWDEWRKMREAPGRIDALEARLAALEAKPKGEICPHCDQPTLRPVGRPVVVQNGKLVERDFRCTACDKTHRVVSRP